MERRSPIPVQQTSDPIPTPDAPNPQRARLVPVLCQAEERGQTNLRGGKAPASGRADARCKRDYWWRDFGSPGGAVREARKQNQPDGAVRVISALPKIYVCPVMPPNGLPEAWRSQVAGQVAESAERLAAESNLADSLVSVGRYAEAEPKLRELHRMDVRLLGPEHPDTLKTSSNLAVSLSGQGKFADAEAINRQVFDVQTRLLGPEHPETLVTAGNLAFSLSDQGKHEEAEEIQREVFRVRKRVLGPEHPDSLTAAHDLALTFQRAEKFAELEAITRVVHLVRKRAFGAEHPDTLAAANHLALSLSRQRKYADSEVLNREVLEARKRMLGAEHPDTLTTASNFGMSLTGQGKHAEAEEIQREVFGMRKRVLGAEHPSTLMTANNLAQSLSGQGKNAEAKQILQATLTSCQQILGPTHPTTLATIQGLETVRARMSTKPPSTQAVIPAGTRVLVQRLIANREHNGKRARVISFDERGGRYVLALDDGQDLSVKPECVARAGCAKAGCTSEEASSVCARCQTVRYCSRECQRADWKAHKPVCAAGQRVAPTAITSSLFATLAWKLPMALFALGLLYYSFVIRPTL